MNVTVPAQVNLCPSWCGNGCTPDSLGETCHLVECEAVRTDHPNQLETVTVGLFRNDDRDGTGTSKVELSTSEWGCAACDWSTCLTPAAARQLAGQLIERAELAEQSSR